MKTIIHLRYWIEYIAFRTLLIIVQGISLNKIYSVSGFAGFVISDVLHYRKRLVKTQLEISFPTFDHHTIKALIKSYYRNLASLILEVMKGFNLSEKELTVRFQFENLHIIEPILKHNQPVIILAGHFGNWEWGIQSLKIHTDWDIFGIYRPLSNPIINQFIKNTRQKRGVRLLRFTDFVKRISRNKEPAIYCLLADQNPSAQKRIMWRSFLNRITAFDGEIFKLQIKYGLQVFYAKTIKLKNGVYNTELFKIECGSDTPDAGKLLEKYAKFLESNIQYQPGNWLWSHRRWKRNVENSNS